MEHWYKVQYPMHGRLRYDIAQSSPPFPDPRGRVSARGTGRPIGPFTKEIAMKRAAFFTALILLTLVVLPGCTSSQSGPPPTKPTFFAHEWHTSTSEVVAMDPATRMITLREEGDQPETYKLGKDVRNVDQLKVGDTVQADYYSSTSIRVLPPGEAVNESTATLARSKPGEKPGGTAASTITRTVEVASVYPDDSEVVTRNAAGQLRTWKVKDGKKLANIQAGERVG
jgi:hypothetical protein